MRVPPLTAAALCLLIVAGCSSGPESVAGDAGPAGSPSAVPVSVVSPSSAPSATPTSSPTSAPTSTRASAVSSSPPATAPASGIRRTDWANVTLADLEPFGDVTFKNGKASPGSNTCTMLPGGARPYYAEYLTEEPASSPVTEDALILVDCGLDSQQQMLVPVQLGYDQKTRQARGSIQADPPPGPDKSMTFTSYRVEGGVIVTGVRKADGTRETRRYRFNGGSEWERI